MSFGLLSPFSLLSLFESQPQKVFICDRRMKINLLTTLRFWGIGWKSENNLGLYFKTSRTVPEVSQILSYYFCLRPTFPRQSPRSSFYPSLLPSSDTRVPNLKRELQWTWYTSILSVVSTNFYKIMKTDRLGHLTGSCTLVSHWESSIGTYTLVETEYFTPVFFFIVKSHPRTSRSHPKWHQKRWTIPIVS